MEKAQTFESVVAQIEDYIRQLKKSQYPDDTRLVMLKGFLGATTGVPELLKQIEDLSTANEVLYEDF